MEVLYRKCGGLDVHKDSVVACARLARGSKVERLLEPFGTTTGELLRLQAWLRAHGITHVAMEATGVYWKPVWHMLAGHFELVLGNAQEIKNVPGRKTDVNDATWIADLLAHGLIRSSFVPPQPIAELRDLTRTRKQLVAERSQHVLRIQKVLEDANVKLASVVADILGVSGRAMLEAMVRGVTEPQRLAKLADGRLKATPAQLEDALLGRVRDHHRFMLRLHLGQIDALDHSIILVESRIEELLVPFEASVDRLKTIPGVKEVAVAVLLAEIGNDMSKFPTAAHLVSWACLAPRNDESAGKRRSTRTRKAQWLKATLVQAAWGAVRQKDTYLHAQFHRIRARRGAKKAILAVAASILTAAYHIIKNETLYQDLGPDYFQRHDRHKAAHRLVQRLQHMGYSVQLQPIAA
jgi:transposase